MSWSQRDIKVIYVLFSLFQLSLAKPMTDLKGLEAAAVPHTWLRSTGKCNCGAVGRKGGKSKEEERRGAEDSLLISTSKSHFNSTNTESSNSSSSSSEDCDTKFIFFHCFHSNFALCLIADVHIQIHAALPPLSLCLLALTHALLRVTQDEKGFRKMQGTFTSHPPFHPQPGWPR